VRHCSWSAAKAPALDASSRCRRADSSSNSMRLSYFMEKNGYFIM
jgi:hypothetical protein